MCTRDERKRMERHDERNTQTIELSVIAVEWEVQTKKNLRCDEMRAVGFSGQRRCAQARWHRVHACVFGRCGACVRTDTVVAMHMARLHSELLHYLCAQYAITHNCSHKKCNEKLFGCPSQCWALSHTSNLTKTNWKIASRSRSEPIKNRPNIFWNRQWPILICGSFIHSTGSA